MAHIVKKDYKIGDMVEVKVINPPCYSLPDGLPDSATVKVVGEDIGSNDVEYNGRVFHVSSVLVDSGYYELSDDAPFRLTNTDYDGLLRAGKLKPWHR